MRNPERRRLLVAAAGLTLAAVAVLSCLGPEAVIESTLTPSPAIECVDGNLLDVAVATAVAFVQALPEGTREVVENQLTQSVPFVPPTCEPWVPTPTANMDATMFAVLRGTQTAAAMASPQK